MRQRKRKVKERGRDRKRKGGRDGEAAGFSDSDI